MTPPKNKTIIRLGAKEYSIMFISVSTAELIMVAII
jgi:hypothetical protein